MDYSLVIPQQTHDRKHQTIREISMEEITCKYRKMNEKIEEVAGTIRCVNISTLLIQQLKEDIQHEWYNRHHMAVTLTMS